MQWLRVSRPSPAIAVAIVALVAALAGTAVAEQASTSAITKKKVKKIAKKEAKKQINKLAPDLSVANAENAESANTVDGDDANNLTQGWATVNEGQNPSIRNFGGKRVTNVSVTHAAATDNYVWTFTGDFEGVETNDVGVITSAFDSDAFVFCSGNNDPPGFPAVTATQVQVRTFCVPNANNTLLSEAHTVQLFIQD